MAQSLGADAAARCPAIAGSKGALHLLTQCTCAELGFRGVAVVGVYPPAVDTRMSRHVAAASKIAPREAAAAVVWGLREGARTLISVPPPICTNGAPRTQGS